MNITKEETASLEACQSADDWSVAGGKIKSARNGMYPPDWGDKVKMSGMMDKIMARWGSDSELRIIDFSPNQNKTKYRKT